MSLIRTKLNQAFLFLQVNESDFDANDIYLHYKGKPLKKDYGVVEVYSLYLARIQKLIGIDIKQVTYDKYVESGRHQKSLKKQEEPKMKRLLYLSKMGLI